MPSERIEGSNVKVRAFSLKILPDHVGGFGGCDKQISIWLHPFCLARIHCFADFTLINMSRNTPRGLTDQKSLVVRTMQPKTKLVNGKVVVVKDESLNWEVVIYHLS